MVKAISIYLDNQQQADQLAGFLIGVNANFKTFDEKDETDDRQSWPEEGYKPKPSLFGFRIEVESLNLGTISRMISQNRSPVFAIRAQTGDALIDVETITVTGPVQQRF